jgi:hypothetical protein
MTVGSDSPVPRSTGISDCVKVSPPRPMVRLVIPWTNWLTELRSMNLPQPRSVPNQMQHHLQLRQVVYLRQDAIIELVGRRRRARQGETPEFHISAP